MVIGDLPAHLKIAGGHDGQRCQVGDEEVDQVVAEQAKCLKNILNFSFWGKLSIIGGKW